MSNTTTEEIKSQVQEGIKQLVTLKDEIKVRMHLAGMEAKDEWKKLEPKVFELENAAKNLSAQAQESVGELVQKLKSLRDAIKG